VIDQVKRWPLISKGHLLFYISWEGRILEVANIDGYPHRMPLCEMVGLYIPDWVIAPHWPMHSIYKTVAGGRQQAVRYRRVSKRRARLGVITPVTSYPSTIDDPAVIVRQYKLAYP